MEKACILPRLGPYHACAINAIHSIDYTRIKLLAVLMYKCQHGMALQYLQMDCEPASTFSSCQLPSAVAGRMTVPHARTNYGDRSFAVEGPWVLNSLPAKLCALELSM